MHDGPVMRRTDRQLLEFDADDTLSVHLPDTEDVVVLNETARSIWRQLDQPRSPAAICEQLADRYGVAPDSIRTDVDAALTALHAAGLLTDGASG